VARRPYRVVFTRPHSGNGKPDKPATIVKADLEAATAEAEAIARSGGTADVLFVSSDGERRLVASYSAPSASMVLSIIRLAPLALLAAVVAFVIVRRLLRR
jgi:hypothetical protein